MNLFSGEPIDFKNVIDKQIEKLSKDKIDEKYIKGEVRIVTEQARYPLNTIPSLLESGNYELNPDFQRRHRWNIEKKSKLIESFIMNVPLPPIFLYEAKFSFYEVMDGLQRLTAIQQFYNNEYTLQGLEEWKELNGFKYSELPEQVRRGIDRRYLSSIILLQETAKNEDEALRLKQLVFERINSGGVTLEPQETRNALYDGRLNRLCIKLARNKYLCEMWGIPEPDESEKLQGTISEELIENEVFRKMEDVELVLRFFAFRQIERYETSSLKQFLDIYLQKGNVFDNNLLSRLEDMFNSTIKLVYDIYGERAFYLWRRRNGKWNWYSRPTKVLFDPMMAVFSQRLDKSKELVTQKAAINKEIKNFYKVNYNEFEGRNTNRHNIIRRTSLLGEFIDGFLED